MITLLVIEYVFRPEIYELEESTVVVRPSLCSSTLWLTCPNGQVWGKMISQKIISVKNWSRTRWNRVVEMLLTKIVLTKFMGEFSIFKHFGPKILKLA